MKYALKILEYSLSLGNIQEKINLVTQHIDDIQQSSFSPQLHLDELNLKQELDSLLLQEEILWKSKCRDTWLTCKDLNTKYVHVSTLIKQRCNAIDFFKIAFWCLDI